MVTLNIDGGKKALRESVMPGIAPVQMTLKGCLRLSGTGLHSGHDTHVAIHPAPADTGIMFYDGPCGIQGLVGNVVDTSRGTTIGCNGSKVRTIEHLMAALRGMGVDNAVVEVTGSEMPALDGSAFPYVKAIGAAGLVELDAERRTIRLTEPVCVQRGDSFILAVPAPSLRITYVMSYAHPMIGSQTATYEHSDCDFGQDFAPARTFVLYEEVAGLLDSKLARGGTVDNVIVVWQDRLSSDLRFPDELVRHKVVDMVGDLSLLGCQLQAEVLAVKSGHSLNIEFARTVAGLLAGESHGAEIEAVTS